MIRRATAIASLVFFAAGCGADSEGTGSATPPPFGGVPPASPGAPVADPSMPGVPDDDGAPPATTAPGAPASETPSSGLPLGGMPSEQTPPSGTSAPSTSPLPRSTPEAEGLSSAGVLNLVNALDGGVGEIHSVMLLRHGKVVAEGWWAPYAAEDVHVLYSVTKSFNSTAVGFAVEEGLLSVDDLITSHFPDLTPANPDPELAAMRVRDLLTMSTGHEVDSIDAMRQRSDGQWTRSFLESNVPRAPGTYFLYNSGAAYMLGALVQRVTGMTVDEYLAPRLFAPLGIAGEIWGQSAERVNLADGGLSVRTEDLAKFGQLYLQGGMWNGQRVLSEQWATDATARQVSTGNDDGNWNFGYGYQFWRSRVGYRADGSLGQFGFVLPEQDIVLAITSGTTDTDGVMNRVWENLLPAVLGDAQPENPAALAALRERLAGLALPVPSGEMTSALANDVSGRRYATAQNSRGIQGVTLDFSGAEPRLTLEDADGTHAIAIGMGSWVRQRTTFYKRINELFDTPEQGLAATGAWSAPDTFVARLCFDETPYTLTASFRFQGEQVRVNMGYNVRWGAATEPEISGVR
ncbi:MAG TPA: serine hydrolase [Polyangiaceae bacterium]|nr:serine hydrolase [Polyangiaceae bacterium]